MYMNIIHLIETKRDGGELSDEQIRWFVQEYAADSIPDYQAAALVMAITIRGMSRRETVSLTLAMAHSGDLLDLHDVAPFTVDKHSSGGVGDKTTLVVQPLVAACGLPVGKMSGRGLGSSGGTLDKMESIHGWSPDLTLAQFKRQLADIGLALAGQTARLAPADGKLYALRDVTGTVPSIPLIASSIMSKKLAGGADAIVLDVKLGSGAFMTTLAQARELAEVMVGIGQDAGKKTTALLSDMNQPLGHAVGNALEVKEAIAALQGRGPADFWAHCLEVAAHMLLLANRADTLQPAKEMLTAARDSGQGLVKFRQMVAAQGGDVRQIDDVRRLPQARLVETIQATRPGYVAAINTTAIGWACVNLGGGRLKKGDTIDHAVGLVMPIKVGAQVRPGDPLCTIHANDADRLAAARAALLSAIAWSDEPAPPLPHFYGVVSGNDLA